MTMLWGRQPIILTPTPLYLGTIHIYSATNLYLLPHWLPTNEEEGKGEGGGGHKIFLSLQAPLLNLQISLEAISGNNLLGRWPGSPAGQTPFVLVIITSPEVLLRFDMISHQISPTLARSLGNTVTVTVTLLPPRNTEGRLKGVAVVRFV